MRMRPTPRPFVFDLPIAYTHRARNVAVATDHRVCRHSRCRHYLALVRASWRFGSGNSSPPARYSCLQDIVCDPRGGGGIRFVPGAGGTEPTASDPTSNITSGYGVRMNSVKKSPFVCLAVHDWTSSNVKSNSHCHPGRAGGLPLTPARALRLARNARGTRRVRPKFIWRPVTPVTWPRVDVRVTS
jgi:hypothetical protein